MSIPIRRLPVFFRDNESVKLITEGQVLKDDPKAAESILDTQRKSHSLQDASVAANTSIFASTLGATTIAANMDKVPIWVGVTVSIVGAMILLFAIGKLTTNLQYDVEVIGSFILFVSLLFAEVILVYHYCLLL